MQRAAPILVVTILACSTSAQQQHGTSGLTFYKDVEPIVQAKCSACHYPGGIGGFAVDAASTKARATLLAQRVAARTMPPWPPGPLTPALIGARTLTQAQIDTITQWSAAGAPLGDVADHRDRPAEITFDPGRPADLRLMMSGDNVYVAPAGSSATDEVRCFVVDLPPDTPNSWVTAVNWVLGQPGAIHHLGGLAVDAASAAKARALYGKDGRAGYECAGGFGEGVDGTAGFSATAAGRDTGTMLPSGTGIFVPAGSSVILSVHYVLKNIVGADASGVELWLARDKKGLRPMVQYTWSAPSEMPCPSGVPANNDDASNPCSRAGGFAEVSSETPDVTRKTNDFLLLKCHRTLADHYAQIQFNPSDPTHLTVPTACEDELPFDGVLHVVHAHMHTRGSSARIEQQNADGSWGVLLDIPRWSWTWEGAYTLAQGVALKKGQRLRLSCTYDNGAANQWSLVSREPGHDGPAAPPLEPPHYVVASPERGSDMCGSFLTIERTAYQAKAWDDVCHETQARYDGVCADGAVSFLSAPCSGLNEQYAVLLAEVSDLAFRHYACTPKGPNATQGATCGDAMTCALTCQANAPGPSQACLDACKANVHAYGKQASPQAVSPKGGYDLGLLTECTQKKCASAQSWKEVVDCATADCTDELEWCYGTKK